MFAFRRNTAFFSAAFSYLYEDQTLPPPPHSLQIIERAGMKTSVVIFMSRPLEDTRPTGFHE